MVIRSISIFISIFLIGSVLSREPEKTKEYSMLCIKYIGPIDKRISPIVISDSVAGADSYRFSVLKQDKWDLIFVHVISDSILAKFVSEVNSFGSKDSREQKTISKSEKTVSVTVVTPQREYSVLFDTQSAVSVLGNLQKQCNGDGSLLSDLVNFKISIPHRAIIIALWSLTISGVNCDHLTSITGGVSKGCGTPLGDNLMRC